MTVFADTSFFYALLDGDDEFHAEAANAWATVRAEGTAPLTTNYVLVEASALLRNRLGVEGVRVFTEDLLPVVNVAWITPDQHRAATSATLLAGRRGPSLVDCTSFEVMRQRGIRRALAFDAHFTDAGFELVGHSISS